MLQTTPSFSRATQAPRLTDLEQIGLLYKAFFEKHNVSMKASILRRDRDDGNGYPILVLVPNESTLQELSECLATVEDKVCSHMRGICLVDIAYAIEASDRHSAGIALVAHQDIVRDFGVQLSRMHEISARPQPAVA